MSELATREDAIEVIRASMDRNFIEYLDFRTNHLSHAAGALVELGVSKNFFREYADHYIKRLETPQGTTATRSNQNTDVEEDVTQLLGARKGFYKLKQHYQHQYQGDLGNLIRSEFPKVMDGMSGSLLHPVIHIAYGCLLGYPELVVEGLAYGHYSYDNPKWRKCWDFSKIGQGDLDVLDILDQLREDKVLKKYMKENMEDKLKFLPVKEADFQANVMALFDKGDDLMNYVMRLKVPDGLNCTNKLMSWLVDQAIKIYTQATGENDFVLLHGVTSFWGLKEVSRYLDQPDSYRAICVLLCGLFAVYIADGCPPMAKKIQKDFGPLTWKELKAEVLAKSHEDVDEHDYKLLQVCLEQSNDNKDDPDMQKIYLAAVKYNIDFKFSFPNKRME